jgi:hypothetical protein
MQSDPDLSLSDEATFAGRPRPQRSDASMGDERTIGDGLSAQDTIVDDIDVVDLAARYRIEGELGQGGMGAVLLATDIRLDRKVAIKRILGEAAGNRMAVTRFLTEAKSIAALNHPNIVQIYDYGRAKDGPFLIMEYVEGGSLLDRCRESAIPLEEAIDLACQLCDGLAKAHDLGIIHRDIKPANVLLTKDGTPKLTDFGLAKATASDHGQTQTGAVFGTPDFMPPEQRRDAALVDHSSDLWSLAATVYQMVTGRSPKVIRLHELPQELQPIIAKALEDEKDARYQSAKEFRDVLKGIGAVGRRQAAPAHFEGVLQEGQCKACGTVASDLTRKFCRNPQCGAGLRVACLKCDAQIPVWDAICGECGGKQPALLAAKRESLTAVRAEAEAKLAALAYDEAIRRAEEVAAESPAELDDLAEWARTFVSSTCVERDHQRALATKHVQDAKKHMVAFDYPAAIQSLKQISDGLRDAEAAGLLAECEARRDESDQLIAEIAARVKREQIDGLLPLVERSAQLRGDRQDLAKVLQQLRERRDSRLAKARAALESGDAHAARRAVLGIAAQDLGEHRQLFNSIHQAAEAEAKVFALAKESLTDRRYGVDEAGQIIRCGEKCLALTPKNRKVQALVQEARQVVEESEKALDALRNRETNRSHEALHGCEELSASSNVTPTPIVSSLGVVNVKKSIPIGLRLCGWGAWIAVLALICLCLCGEWARQTTPKGFTNPPIAVAQRIAAVEPVALIGMLLAHGLMVIGLSWYAIAKGRSIAWALCGLNLLPALIALYHLRDDESRAAS